MRGCEMKLTRRVATWCDPGLRVVWCAVLTSHVWMMIAYWWPTRPHGFPLTHRKFWVNEALPWILSAFYRITIERR